MIYCRNPVDAVLVRKVNRFLCEINMRGRTYGAHIPNSGRLTELMTPGRKVIVEPAENRERKTLYTLRSVWFNRRWVCVDAVVPNALAAEIAARGSLKLFSGHTNVRREVSVGRHRFDLLLTGRRRKPALVEVKSVTLVQDGVAKFPDAPTIRGADHLRSLAALARKGDYHCAVLFVVQRSDARRFEPNTATDPAFAAALKEAVRSGVKALSVRCRVGRRGISMMDRIPMSLGD